MQANSEEMQEAETTPYGKYPELVTYTLGKMSGENNSNMPDGDTYEDNAYTRYLRDMLNVQNKDVFEASGGIVTKLAKRRLGVILWRQHYIHRILQACRRLQFC